MSRVDARDKGEPQQFWAEFAADPRSPTNAALRASDRDRDVVHRRLAEAYADGRLDREELDERTSRVQAARTLGELPGVVADLVAPDPPRLPARSGPEELRVRAEQRYASDRREAFLGMLVPSLVCVVIWVVAGLGFPWPLFVVLGTGIHLLQTLVRRDDLIEAHVRKLEKRERRALERPSGPRAARTDRDDRDEDSE
jgi:hypothetical protein